MTGDRTQAQQLYKAGRALYAEQRFEEALSAFDRALSLGDRSWKIVDAKAAAMNKLGGPWRQAALEVARTATKKFGKEVHQTWYRLGVVCVALDLLDEAEAAAKQGLKFCPPSAYEQYETLSSTISKARADAAAAQAALEAEDAEEAARAKKRRTNYTHLLNADVLLGIAEAGLATDPNIGLRLAGVCTSWRNIVLGHPPLWRRLVLTHRRPLAKLTLFTRRGRQMTEITLKHSVGDERVAVALRGHVREVERLTFDGFTYDQIVRYTDNWRGMCAKLTDLVVKNSGGDRPMAKRGLFFGLLDPNASSLQRAEVPAGYTGAYTSQDIVPRYGSREWVPRSAQLANLRHLRLHNAELHLPLSSLLALMPALEWAEFDVSAPLPTQNERIDLPALKHLHLGNQRSLDLNNASLPSLESLSLYRSGVQVPSLDLTRFRALTSLDVGFCYLGPQFANVLRELSKLRFLGLTGCSVQNDLLEHLVVAQGKPALMPELSALSLAANDEIGAGPVRRIVLSRNLGALDSRPKQKAPAAKSPFAPAAGPFAPKRAAKSGTAKQAGVGSGAGALSRTQSQSSSSERSLSRQNSEASLPSASAPQPPSTAAINFLVLDHCHSPHMDAGVLAGLRRYVGFVSYANPQTVDEDRIRGRGAYDWTKAKNVDAGCHLRKREAGEAEGWYVHHNCKAARTA